MAVPADQRLHAAPPASAVPSEQNAPGLEAQRARLEQAYEFFGRVSDQLSQSQDLLQAQVDALKSQLADVSAQRSRELAEKARLAGRLQNLLDLLPGGHGNSPARAQRHFVVIILTGSEALTDQIAPERAFKRFAK